MNQTSQSTGDRAWTRREFMKTAAVAGVAANVATAWAGTEIEKRGDMPYRALGRTGEKVSLIGLGGYHVGVQATEAESIRIIRSALDRGVNFLDNCWDYNGGASEIRMGKALKEGYRAKAFLMSKIDGRTKESAARQIDESLRRLQVDHVDLMQFHEIIRPEDPGRVFAAGGALEAMQGAQKAGKIRFIGFTGHKSPDLHLKMLAAASENKFRFDAVQMPLNVMDAHFRSFEHKVVPQLVQEGVGVLGMKSMGSGEILRSKVVTPIECLHYAMNLPTATVIAGMESLDRLDQALEAARTFRPLTTGQVKALLARTADAAATGEYEPFKTTTNFDGTRQHPEWLG
jgi:predicted aldo/keto reductase-like oxidoreductase